jgi:DNA-binding NarL/FixJ family response regulator
MKATPRQAEEAVKLAVARVLLIEEPGILRDGVCALLQAGGVELVAVASNRREALQAMRQNRPQVVILDLSPPLKTGPETIQQLKRRWPQLRVVVLTLRRDTALIESALGAGADGYLHKGESRAELQLALQRVMAGKRYVRVPAEDPDLGDQHKGGERDAPVQPGALLTAREQEVIAFVARGYRTREMATLMSLSHKTVEKHRTNLMRKLGLRSAAAVAAYAIRRGLV